MSATADRSGPATDLLVADSRGGWPLRSSRWIGWRLRLLVGAALLGCVGLFLLAQWLASPPSLHTQWRVAADGRIEIASSTLPALAPHVGRRLVEVRGAGQRIVLPDALALHRSARWLTDDADRARYQALQVALGQALTAPDATLVLEGAGRVAVAVALAPRGLSGLPALFWVLGALALLLWLVALVVLLARPSTKNLLYAVMTLSQAGNLAFMAVESTVELGIGAAWPGQAFALRVAFDAITAAAVVHAACVHPHRLPHGAWIAAAGWAFALALGAAAAAGALPLLWWWVQGGIALLALAAVALMRWSYRLEPHPFAIVLRRFGLTTIATWLLLTGALAAASGPAGTQHTVAAIGSQIWYVFFASLLLLVPFLSKSQQVMREFALLAAVSTIATSLDLLFVAVFSLGQFASLTLSLFAALAVYAAARQWIVDQLLGTSMVTTERMFEQLYRIAREVEAHPDRVPALLMQLLRELFEPLESRFAARSAPGARVSSDGSTLMVPVPALAGSGVPPTRAVVLRFAQRGRRLFTSEDARLTDRIGEQLERAVAFDRAVEQGRAEERARIAQDLHDDIGARLLTLIYQAPTPEMEDYVRHTLADLKTLTRGLARSNHRLSHAAAEWKADLTQRMTAADVELEWNVAFDRDRQLSVVQWSALTRVLRELASNTIAHAGATHVRIRFVIEGERAELVVTDNGTGRDPAAWSHGLGLGGVRKRVKQLGGEVEWIEAEPCGITCRVTLPGLSPKA